MEKLPSLNGLRALAITIVISYHLVKFKFSFDPYIFLHIPIFDGQFGVNVFFVISGFLITSLLLREEERNGSISLKSFFIRRALRIFPAYFFLLFVYWVLQYIGLLSIPKASWLTALTYTKYLNYKLDWCTAHAWSLSIEENFYFLWPFIFLAGSQIRKSTTISLILLVPLVRTWIYFNPVNWINDLSFFTRIDAIAMGCYFALNKEAILSKLSSNWNQVFYLSVATLFILPWLAELSNETAFSLIFISLGTLHGTIANVFIALIMMYSVFGPSNRWHAVLNSSPFNYIGILSYSLYLWQQFYVAQSPLWVNDVPQNILLIFVTAMFSYYIIEKPFLKLKSKYSDNRKARNYNRHQVFAAKKI